MQVTAASTLLSPLIATTSGNKAKEPPIAEFAPATNNSTADKVTLGQTQDSAGSYDLASVYISGLRDNKPRGQAASAISQNLLSSLNSFGAGKSPFSIGGVFSQIGSLSRETNEYKNEARRMKVTQEMAVKSPVPNFDIRTSSNNQSVHLNIKTKDGDTIKIELSNRNIGTENSTLEFSFTVDGSLSEAEQKALGELAEKLGQMGDEFFRTDTTELRDLKGIDTSVISGFSFTLTRPDGKGDFVEQSYEFSVDEEKQTQTLRASDVRGYSVDITTNLNALMESSTADVRMLEPYLKLIREATDDADTNNKSRRFMLDAFESMFAQFINRPAPPEAETATDATLAAFDSGLPDFTATIRSKVIHNREFYSQTSALVLNLTQETRIETNADTRLIKQESRYELSNNWFEGILDLESPGVTNPNYRYITEHREGNVSRILSMSDDKVNNLLVEQNVSGTKEVSEFINYKLVDKTTDELTDHKLQQFSNLLATLNDNKQYTAINELLKDSKNDVFLDYK